MERTEVFLIRHATTAKVGKALTGWLPGIPLDELGKAQARGLVERLRGVRIDAIWSSPLQRAMETAAPLSVDRGLEIQQNPEFGEVNFGAWQGRTLAELGPDPVFGRFHTYRSGTRAPGGELMLETQARMVRGLLNLAAGHPGQSVAVFSHADAIKCAIMHALGVPIDFHHRLEIEPASVTVCHFQTEEIRVIRTNIKDDIQY